MAAWHVSAFSWTRRHGTMVETEEGPTLSRSRKPGFRVALVPHHTYDTPPHHVTKHGIAMNVLPSPLFSSVYLGRSDLGSNMHLIAISLGMTNPQPPGLRLAAPSQPLDHRCIEHRPAKSRLPTNNDFYRSRPSSSLASLQAPDHLDPYTWLKPAGQSPSHACEKSLGVTGK